MRKIRSHKSFTTRQAFSYLRYSPLQVEWFIRAISVHKLGYNVWLSGDMDDLWLIVQQSRR